MRKALPCQEWDKFGHQFVDDALERLRLARTEAARLLAPSFYPFDPSRPAPDPGPRDAS